MPAVVPSLEAWPRIIQGGMGVGVSSWRLARAVSQRGQVGVVSGTMIEHVFVRRLQDGDPGGHMRRAMERFPLPEVAAAALERHFRPNGRAANEPYTLLPVYQQVVTRSREQLTMLAAYVEVALAKEGHDGLVGMNLLTKVQFPNLATLYGAMLAGVDAVLMGAGIPREIPGALDALAEGREATLRMDVEEDSSGTTELLRFDPRVHFEAGGPPQLKRPAFLAIVSSHLLASVLARKASGRVDGFVIEGHRAGGHNAPPRVNAELNEAGEPVYGERDVVDLGKMRDLGRPFWLAGGSGRPEKLREALAEGARGVQVGSLFAFCEESGVEPELKHSVVGAASRGELSVFTDPLASPTGYPFKVAQWPGDTADHESRERICDLGALRVAYRKPDGAIGYRCAAAPVEAFVQRGGDIAETVGRKCLCNALMATVGLPQLRDGKLEPTLVTAGDELTQLGDFLDGRTTYTAAEAIDWLLGAVPAE
jgi:NAD(P)H-dependent flavin oxidoreductase YrpB (nitropropane dioxygenase family)